MLLSLFFSAYELGVAALDQQIVGGLVAQLDLEKGQRAASPQQLCINEHLVTHLGGLHVRQIHVH